VILIMQVWLAIQPIQRIITILIIVCILANIDFQYAARPGYPQSDSTASCKYENSPDRSVLETLYSDRASKAQKPGVYPEPDTGKPS
jgi:hypothetical protein